MIGKAERTKERYKTDRDNLDFVGRRGRRPLHHTSCKGDLWSPVLFAIAKLLR